MSALGELVVIKKIVLGCLIVMAVCSLLLVGQIKLATWFYDNKLNSVISKVEQRIPGLKLEYKSTEQTFTGRKGRLFFTLPLKPGNKLGESHVSGALDIALLFGPLRVSGAFNSVPEIGNISDILQKYNVAPLTVRGAFLARAITPLLEGSVKTDSFLLPTSTGVCKFGQNAVHFAATSPEDLDLQLKSAGVVCEGAMRYNDRPNYRLDLTGVNINFLPRIINKKPHFDSLEVNFENLDFKFSTLYALGFEPDDNVKDPSLQEAISFTNVSTLVTMSSPDSEGMSKLSFDNSGNYGFAFPYIKDNQVQPYYKFEDFKLAGSVERMSFANLIEAFNSIMKSAGEQFDSNAVVKAVLRGFSDEIKLTIEQFGYKHEGLGFMLSGDTVLALDESSKKLKLAKFDSRYEIEADQALVKEVAGENYASALDAALASQQITAQGDRYHTVFEVHGKDAFLNSIPIKNLVADDEQLYAEEQKMQAAQEAAEKQQQEALEAEIRAAREAQNNLPSFYESQQKQIEANSVNEESISD